MSKHNDLESDPMSDQPYAVYAIRCGDGSRDRHPSTNRGMRALVLQQASRLEGKPCGPHVIDFTIVHPLEWSPVDLSVPDPQTARKDQVIRDALDVACPQCQVPAGADCENLTARRAGATVFTAWPHPDRISLASIS